MSPMSDPNSPDIALRPNPQGAPPARPPSEVPRRSSGGMGALLGAVAAAVIAFGGGLALGVFYMGVLGYHTTPGPEASAPGREQKQGPGLTREQRQRQEPGQGQEPGPG